MMGRFTNRIGTAVLAATMAVSLLGVSGCSSANAGASCADYKKFSTADKKKVAADVLSKLGTSDSTMKNAATRAAIAAYCGSAGKDKKVSDGLEDFKALKESLGG